MSKHTNQLHTNAKEESEVFFSTVLNLAHEAIIAIDQNQNIILFNEGAKRVFGYNASEVIGQPLEILLPPTLSEIHRAHVRGFAESATVSRMMGERRELSGRRKDGTIFPAEASIAKVPIRGQTFFSVVLRDISEKKSAEQILAEKEQRYRSTLDNMLEGCQIIGFDWRYLYLNAAAEKHNRRANEELLGKKYMDMWSGIEATEVFALIRRCMEERIAHQMENEFIFPDGTKGWFELSIQPAPEGIFILSQDITERKRIEIETLRRLQNIQALQKIDQAIAGSLDLKLTLNVVLEQTKIELNVDAAAVLLFNPHTQILEFAAGIGFRGKAIERSRLRLGEGHGGRVALERRTVSVTNLFDAERSDQFLRAPLLADEGLVTYFGTPLIAKGQVKGVLEVFQRTPFIPEQDWLDFLEVLAGQAAIAVDSASLFADLQHSNTELFNAYDSTIEGWSHALDLRDKETEGHTLRVTEMTMRLAHAAGITESELVHVRRGALLHDIGKMGVPDNILLKPDKLTDEEWVAMRKHPIFAFELLSPIAYLRPALDIPYCHHEKWDGSGYPRGLKGEQIPLAARLFAVIDVWDALRSDRPYRQGWSKEKVIDHIKSLSGTHFEPKVVELFLNMMNEDDKDSL